MFAGLLDLQLDDMIVELHSVYKDTLKIFKIFGKAVG